MWDELLTLLFTLREVSTRVQAVDGIDVGAAEDSLVDVSARIAIIV